MRKTQAMKTFTPFKTIMTMFVMVLFFYQANAQCNAFIKKKCMPNIAPFTHNGQTNTSMLTPGHSIEVGLTIYSGQDYRILVCGEEILGECSFKVMDQSRKVLFDSKKNDSTDFWDFKSKSSQQLIVEVTANAPESTSSTPPSGCVSVLVGFKKDK